MHAREPYRRLSVPELVRRRPEALGEQPLVVAVALAFLDAVPAVGDRKRDDCSEPGCESQGCLERLYQELALLASLRYLRRRVPRESSWVRRQ